MGLQDCAIGDFLFDGSAIGEGRERLDRVYYLSSFDDEMPACISTTGIKVQVVGMYRPLRKGDKRSKRNLSPSESNYLLGTYADSAEVSTEESSRPRRLIRQMAPHIVPESSVLGKVRHRWFR
jgi:hypothetical protein